MTRLTSLTVRERRTLPAGIAALAVILLAGRGWPLWHHWLVTERAAATETTLALAEAQDLVANREALQTRLAQAGSGFAGLASWLTAGSTAATAAANFSTAAAAVAGQAGLSVTSAQSYTDTSGGTFDRIGVRLNAAGDVTGLTRFLDGLARDPSLMVPREITVDQSFVASPVTEPEVLHIQLRIEGFRLRQPGRNK